MAGEFVAAIEAELTRLAKAANEDNFEHRQMIEDGRGILALQASGHIVPNQVSPIETSMRTFETGATRDGDQRKPNYVGFISPLVTKRFGEYMNLHRQQADGTLRDASNWKLGIPKEAYTESLVRHVEDVRLHHDGYADEAVDADLESVLCAVIFNAQGLLLEVLKERRQQWQASLRENCAGATPPQQSAPSV